MTPTILLRLGLTTNLTRSLAAIAEETVTAIRADFKRKKAWTTYKFHSSVFFNTLNIIVSKYKISNH